MIRRPHSAGWLVYALVSACAAPPPPAPAHAPSLAQAAPTEASPAANPGAQQATLGQPVLAATATAAVPPSGEVTRDGAGGEPIEELSLPQVADLVEQAIARGELPGCVVAIGDHERLRYLRAFGLRALQPPEPMTEDTLFDIASVTKALATTSSLMRLEEQGKLNVDAPVARYLPAFGASGKRAVRVQHLLTHTGGLPRVDSLNQYEGSVAANFARINRTPLVHPLGRVFNYSDLGFIVLGELVERLGGEPLNDFAQHQVFTPLGMTRTRFLPPKTEIARTAPTELREEVLIRGEVDDPRSYRLGGVAGNAGVFSDAHDLSRFARMLLQQGELDGERIFEASTIKRWTAPRRAGQVQRGLGWDALSGYAKGRGKLMGPRTFGHSGYTGVSLWVDPDHDLFVLLLSNRVHVGPKGSIYPLASSLADMAVEAKVREDKLEKGVAPARVASGIDVLEATHYAALRGRRIALLTNDAARDRLGKRTADVLRQTPDVQVATLWTPEHGMTARREGHIKNGRAGALQVHSLFGKTREPTRAMLHGADTVVVDLQDVGARFYTYAATVDRVLRFAEREGIDVWILDRPNPLGGMRVEGPVTDAGYESFVNYFPLPVQHGLTMGELATLLANAHGHRARPGVVRMQGWRRDMRFGETGLRWYAPSPNLRSLAEVTMYPAVALVEGTNVSVGRGTNAPFELVGAPYVDAEAFATSLRAADLPGVSVSPAHFRPASARHRGVTCHGVRLQLTDPAAFDPMRTGLAIARALMPYRPHWDDARLSKMLAHASTLAMLEGTASYDEIAASWQPGIASFEQQRSAALLYPAPLAGAPEDAELRHASAEPAATDLAQN